MATGAPPPMAVEAKGEGTSAPWPKPFAAWYAVWLICLVSMLSNIDRGVITLLVRPIKADLHLNDTEISLLIGFAFSFFYIIVGFPLSRFIDRGNRKAILSGALALWSVATAACGLASTFAHLFLARGVVGAGESAKGPASMSMIADLVQRDKLPRAYSIFSLGITGGMAASLVIGGVLLALFNKITPLHVPIFGELHAWQLVFAVVSIPGLLLALLILLTVPEPKRHGRITKTGSVPLGEVVRFVWAHRMIYAPMLLSLGVVAIDFYGLEAWRPTFFERTFGWGPAMVGPILGGTALIAGPIGLFLGTMLCEYLDRKGHHDSMLRSVMIAQLLSVVFVIAGPLMPNPWVSLVVSMLGITGYWMAAPGQNAALQIITPNEMRAQLGAVYLFIVSAVGGAVGPTFVALITDYVLHDETWLRYAMAATGVIICPIALLLVWLSIKPYGEAVRRIKDREAKSTV